MTHERMQLISVELTIASAQGGDHELRDFGTLQKPRAACATV
jgi:hypothetical protein